MSPTQPAVQRTPPTPGLYWVVIAIFCVLALVPTIWTSVDVWAASLFVGPERAIDSITWFWVEWINLYVPAAFRVMVLAALIGWLVSGFTRYGKRWRLQFAFIVLAGAMGPGVLVNSGFKENWQRARPYQVEQFGGTQEFTRAGHMTDQCNNNCSFVSGHVACGFFFVSLMLIQPRRKIAWTVVGVSAGLLIGFSRMSDVAHWLSDVLWAAPITLICSWVIWKALTKWYPNPTPIDGTQNAGTMP